MIILIIDILFFFFSFFFFFFFFNDTATTEIYTLSLHDALPISSLNADPSPSPTLRRIKARRARRIEALSQYDWRSTPQRSAVIPSRRRRPAQVPGEPRLAGQRDPMRRTSPVTTVKVSAYAVTASRDRQCAEMPVRSSRSDGKVLGTLRSTPSIRVGSSKSWRCSGRPPPRTR